MVEKSIRSRYNMDRACWRIDPCNRQANDTGMFIYFVYYVVELYVIVWIDIV
jgi:hypothetical protein